MADAELVAAWVPDGPGLRLSVALGDGAASLAGLDLRLDDRMVREVVTGARGVQLEVTDPAESAWLEAVAAAGVGPVLALPLLRFAGAPWSVAGRPDPWPAQLRRRGPRHD